MKSVNPATGETIAEYPDLDAAGIEIKLALAAKCFPEYRTTSFSQRATWMRHAASLLRERASRYGALMTAEMGKTVASAESEVEKCAWVCDYYAENAERFLTDEAVETDASHSFIAFQPIGPVLAIMPWNFPFWQCFRFAAPALMAGNVGLLKHASNVPGSALAIEEVLRDAGFPEGAFQTLLIGSDKIASIIEDGRVKGVTLTGSEEAGRQVGAAAGRSIKKVVLELGGSDPFIVMPSADLDLAIKTAVTARHINNGQSCIAAKRFIVHEAIMDEFAAGFSRGVAALKVGNPMDRSVDIGPLAKPEFVDTLHEQVTKSVEAGAKLLTGGNSIEGKGSFYQPTVLATVTKGMTAFDEETFGPVAALISAKSVDEAIAMANDSRFGLGASAWTKDPVEQERFVRELEAGAVFINGQVKSDPRIPFGGVKASGVGRELAEFGIREFVNIKSVWVA